MIPVEPARDSGEDAGRERVLQRIEELVAERGLAHTVAAFVADCENYLWDAAAIQLRSMLDVAPQEVYDEAAAALTLLRGGSLRLPPGR